MRTTVLFFTAMLAAGCGGSGDSCTTLAGSGNLAGFRNGPTQVVVETKFFLVDLDSFNDLGLDLNFTLSAPLVSNTSTALGGVSNQGSDVVADGATVGGPSGIPYLVTNGYDGPLSLVNLNFTPPFAGQSFKVFMTLPFSGQCLTIDIPVADEIQNFAGGADQAPLPPTDLGLDGNVLYGLFDDAGLAALISQIQADTRNEILDAPNMTTFDGQKAVIVLQDTNPQTSDLTPPFRNAVESVVAVPFEISSGATVMVTPTVSTDRQFVTMTVIPSLSSSFQRSVPAQVNGQSADVEIPVIAPGSVKTALIIEDGQTAVIGGLLRQGQTVSEAGIPILSKLPIINTLFKKVSNDNQTLLLSVTARIILGEEDQ